MKEKDKDQEKSIKNLNTQTPGALDVKMFMMRQELARKGEEQDSGVRNQESE